MSCSRHLVLLLLLLFLLLTSGVDVFKRVRVSICGDDIASDVGAHAEELLDKFGGATNR